jgi:superfamily II DNA or RNA helicase
MKSIAHIFNDSIRIDHFDNNIESELMKHLSYVDKSKQYQLKRMRRNPFAASPALLSQLEKESQGSLLNKEENLLVIPSGFASLVQSLVHTVIDNRKETGEILSLPWVSQDKAIQLRPYQEEAVDKAIENWRGIINLATGLGKSKTAIMLIKKIKRKTLVVCPSKSIAYQFYNELVECFGKTKIGFIGDGKYKPSAVTVGIAASVSNRISDIKNLGLGVIIFDETHHTPANTFYAIAEGLGAVGRIYGLTATAFRSDGKDLFIHAACGDILVERDVSWGVANGWLSQPYFIIRTINTTGYDYKDDKLKAYKAHVLNSKEMNERIIADAKAFINANKNTLILVDQIEHGDMISSALGISFANGRDKGSERFIDEFNHGKIRGLVATDGLVGEGVDTRSVEVLLLANFTASKSAVLQAVGRGLRKTETKDKCIVLDYQPLGSSLLSRHSKMRISYYKEITHNVKILVSNKN